jgi:hypothetical protein
MNFKDETTRTLAISGEVLDQIYKLKVKHILPVKIDPGQEIDNLLKVTVVFDKEDTMLINWMLDKAVNMQLDAEEV